MSLLFLTLGTTVYDRRVFARLYMYEMYVSAFIFMYVLRAEERKPGFGNVCSELLGKNLQNIVVEHMATLNTPWPRGIVPDLPLSPSL